MKAPELRVAAMLALVASLGFGMLALAGSSTSTMGPDVIRTEAWDAADLQVDTVSCALGAAAVVNSGPKISLISCADADTGIIYGDVAMPDSWNRGTVAFQVEMFTDAADPAGDVGFGCSCFATGPGDAVAASWGTAAVADVDFDAAAIVQNDFAATTTVAQATCAGASSATSPVHLFWRCVVSAARSTATPLSATAGSTDFFATGVKMEYSLTGSGD